MTTTQDLITGRKVYALRGATYCGLITIGRATDLGDGFVQLAGVDGSYRNYAYADLFDTPEDARAEWKARRAARTPRPERRLVGDYGQLVAFFGNGRKAAR